MQNFLTLPYQLTTYLGILSYPTSPYVVLAARSSCASLTASQPHAKSVLVDSGGWAGGSYVCGGWWDEWRATPQLSPRQKPRVHRVKRMLQD